MRALIATLEREQKGGEGEAPPRIVVTCSELEALAEAVATNPRGVVLWRDEPTAWLADLVRLGWKVGGVRPRCPKARPCRLACSARCGPSI